MATKTFGTSAATSLTALAFLPGIGSMAPADLATIDLIKDDLNVAHPLIPNCFDSGGMLWIPNRGFLRVYPGDYVAVDSTGWPILVSANAVANGPWQHS